MISVKTYPQCISLGRYDWRVMNWAPFSLVPSKVTITSAPNAYNHTQHYLLHICFSQSLVDPILLKLKPQAK